MIAMSFAAHAEPEQGWGRLLGLFIAGLVFWGGTVAHRRWKAEKQQGAATPSPGPITATATAAKPQVTAGSGSSGSGGTVAVKTKPTIDEFVAARYGKVNTAQIVRDAKRVFNAAPRTVYRVIDRVKQTRKVGTP